MKNLYFKQVLKGMMGLAIVLFTSNGLMAQLSGAFTVPSATYPTLLSFITDLNAQGVQVGGGGVVLLVAPGFTETAPAGGYTITATGSVSDNITIYSTGGTAPIITASNTLTAGSLTDAIFKIIGGDYINIAGFDMRENAANTTTAVATNNMTEFGVALFYASATNGAQNNSIIGNSITLNKIYTNTFGIYSNTRHTSTVVTVTADITAFSGSNSNNKIYSNVISNVNMGIAFIGSNLAAAQDSGNDIGGTALTTGNNISNWGGAAATSGYIGNSGTSYCVFMNHQINDNVSFNTISSASVTGTAVTFVGVRKDFTATPPSGAYTSTISNNTITLRSGFTSGIFSHIVSVSGNNLATYNFNNNTFLNSAVSGAASSSTMVGLQTSSAVATLNANNNIIQGWTSTATTGGFTGVTNTGAVTTAVNMNNNQIGNATAGAITYSVGTTGAILGLSNSSGTATMNLNISNNDFRGFVQTGTTSSTHFYIVNSNACNSQTFTGNTFTNITNASTGNVRFIANDVALLTAASSATVTNNSIVTAYNKTGAGGIVFFYYTSVTPSSVVGSTKTETGNNFSNITVTGATTISGWADLEGATGGGSSKNVNNNSFINVSGGTGAFTLIQINYGGGASTIQNNIVTGISGGGAVTGIVIGGSNGGSSFTISGNTTTSMSSTGGNVIGINSGAASTASININNNTINTLSSTAVAGQAIGILASGNALSTYNIFNNNINTLSCSGTSGALVGIANVGTVGTFNIYNNKIYNFNSSGITTLDGVFAISIQGGLVTNVYNNVISDLRNPQGTTANSVSGISSTHTNANSTTRIYDNSIYLSGSSTGTNFGTSGVSAVGNATATTNTLDLRNNIIINECVANGTGLTVALRRSNASNANFATTSNRNMLYAGTPSASKVIYFDGTTVQQTLAAYQAAVTPREANSFTGEATFIASGYGTAGNFFTSLSGASTDFLRPVSGITTQVESGANNTTTPVISTDYFGVIRGNNAGYAGTGTNPDLGAIEFEGITPTPVITLNSVTPPATTQCATTNRLVSVNITTSGGTVTGAVINYSFNGSAQTPITMTNTAGSTWEGTMLAATPANATVTWNVVATNSLGVNGTYTGTSYSDEPLFGYTAAATASSSTVCSGSTTALTAFINNPSFVATYSTPAITNATVDEDIRTVRISQGASILLDNSSASNSLTGTIGTATGTAGGYSNFSALTSTSLTGGQTYTLFVASIDLPTYYTNYATAFIDFNKDGDFADAGESLIPANGLMLNATPDNGNDSISVSFIVPMTAINGTTRLRVVNTETGQTNAAGTLNNAYGEFEDYAITISGAAPGTTNNITSVSWMDGASPVGTGNPLSVNPTITTTYSANITAFGCVYSPAPTVTVNVNALPSSVTTTNSAQCGTQIPTASVTSTTGATAPTFNWYDAMTAGTLLQTSTSSTYTSTVATTTTFYVSEVDGVTGCESSRTAVTVNVSSPDPIAVSPATTSICLGETVTLTAANTNPTPFQTYTYSFESLTTGSGAETAIAGNPVTITPTIAGVYTYTATGTDGGCATTATSTVTVNALPIISNTTASPLTVCSDANINLSATIVPAMGGTATLGTQTTAEFGGGVYRYGFGTGDFRHQLLYTAAEMTTAGFTAGNITSAGFTVTTAGTGSSNNYTIRMANTVVVAPLTTTFETGTFTTVYSAATYTATAGMNTHTFATPFVWDGTSNILLEICYNISTIGSTSTVAATTPAARSNHNLLATVGACTQVTGGNTFVNRPLTTFSQDDNANHTWTWSPGVGLNASAVTTSITNNTGAPISQVFTVTATNNATTCSNTATTASVTINPSTAAPIATNSTQCGAGIPTASVTGSGTPGNTFEWYTTATGGTAIAGESGNTLTTTSVSTTTTFYVLENNGTCSSPRVAVTVTVNPTDAISVSASSGTTICIGSSVDLSAVNTNPTPVQNYTYTWSSTANSGASTPVVGSTVTITPTVPGTYVYNVAANDGICNTSAQISVTVNPFTTVLAPVDLTCNGINTGSFSVTSSNCGTLPYAFSIDGGAFGPAPTNMAAGTYSIVSQDANGYLTAAQSVTISQPATTISNPIGTDATVCQDAISAPISATSESSTPTPASIVVSFDLTAQPVEVNAAPGSVIMSATMPALPAGATVTNAVLSFPGTISNGGSYQSEIRLGVQGAVVNTAAAGTGSLGTNGAYDYVRTLPAVSVNAAGGLVEILYWNSFNDIVGGDDATFPMGVGVATLTINYTLPTPATIAWYDAATNGTNLGTGSPFETVGTSVLPTTATPGTYTFFAEGQFGGCPSVSRTAVTVTVLAPSTSTTTVSQCESSPYTWTDGNTYTVSGTYTQTLTNAVGCDSIATLQLTLFPATSSTTTITNCGAYTWTDGNTYPSSGTFTQTLVNANGCDSIATLNLTILNNSTSTSTTSISSCTPFTWTNGVTYSATGSYQQTLTNSVGCDSIATLVFTFNGINATVTNNGNNTLTASTGSSYQWINCTTNTAVSGATTQNFAPTVNGNYAVVVTNASGCSDTSVCVLISTIGIKENNSGLVDVFPNPTHDNVTITMSAASATVLVMDAQGKVLNTVSIKTGEIVSLAKYETGVYFLKITTESGSTLERIVKN